MKKLLSALCALSMLVCSLTALPLSAEDSQSDVFQAGNYTYPIEDVYSVTDQNLIYFSLKTQSDYIPLNQDGTVYTPPAGTCQISSLLNTLLNQYPDATFSVKISSRYVDSVYDDLKTQYMQEHTFNDKTYAEFLSETEPLIQAHEAMQTLSENEEQTVLEAYRIQNEIKDYVWSLASQELDGEYQRLQEAGLNMLEPRPNYYGYQAYLTADQIRNFPVNPKISYCICLASLLEYDPDEESKHTFSHTPADLRYYDNMFSQSTDHTFYYTCISDDGRILEDQITEEYVPNAGTFDCSELVNGLIYAYPDAKFSVFIQPYGDIDRLTDEKQEFLTTHFINHKSYADIMSEFYSADANGQQISKEFGSQVSQIVQEQQNYLLEVFDQKYTQTESDRLRENNIPVTSERNGKFYATLTADQIENFPVSSKFGYFICLASAIGDAVPDGNINIVDAIQINRAVIGKDSLTDTQLNSADVNQNGVPDAEDSLAVLKYVIGITSSLTE